MVDPLGDLRRRRQEIAKQIEMLKEHLEGLDDEILEVAIKDTALLERVRETVRMTEEEVREDPAGRREARRRERTGAAKRKMAPMTEDSILSPRELEVWEGLIGKIIRKLGRGRQA